MSQVVKTETFTKVVAEISNNCTCEVWYESEDDFQPASECGGCYEESLAYLKDEFFPLWESVNKATDTVRIEGKNMGWTHASGWLVTEVKNLLDALSLRGDYTLTFVLEPDKPLSVTRYSHDEPMGASFEVTFVPDEEFLV